MFRLSAMAITAIVPLALLADDTLVLRDGTQFTGRMTSATQNSVSFRDSRGEIRRFNTNEIESLRFNTDQFNRGNSYNNGNNGNYQNGGFQGDGRQGNNDFGNRGYNNNSGARSRNYMTVAPGTEISVRTNENIAASDANDGRFYSAQVNRDVMDQNGQVLIPRGSDAQLVVRRLSNNTLALDLQSISVNGRRYNVDSAEAVAEGNTRDGVGNNKRTAEYVGGGAVLGTLLGAIAGGGKGAAIGALAGGAAGAGAQVLTRGSQVRVPAESELSFRLDAPMTLRY